MPQRRSAACWRGALTLLHGVLRCAAFCRCFATFVAAFLHRFWLRQQPCGSLRRPRRDRGIASSPYSLLGFSSHPFVPPPLRYGDGGGGAVRSYAARWRWGAFYAGLQRGACAAWAAQLPRAWGAVRGAVVRGAVVRGAVGRGGQIDAAGLGVVGGEIWCGKIFGDGRNLCIIALKKVAERA